MTDTHVAGPPSIAALGASYAVASDQTSSKRSFCPAFGRSDCIAVIPLIAEKAKTTVVNIGRQSLVHFRCTLTPDITPQTLFRCNFWGSQVAVGRVRTTLGNRLAVPL